MNSYTTLPNAIIRESYKFLFTSAKVFGWLIHLAIENHIKCHVTYHRFIVELRDAKGARGQSDGPLSLQFFITRGGLRGFVVGQNLDKT